MTSAQDGPATSSRTTTFLKTSYTSMYTQTYKSPPPRRQVRHPSTHKDLPHTTANYLNTLNTLYTLYTMSNANSQGLTGTMACGLGPHVSWLFESTTRTHLLILLSGLGLSSRDPMRSPLLHSVPAAVHRDCRHLSYLQRHPGPPRDCGLSTSSSRTSHVAAERPCKGGQPPAAPAS